MTRKALESGRNGRAAQLAELERAWRKVAARLLNNPDTECSITVRQHKRMGSSISADFTAGEWTGTLVLSRPKVLELSASEVGALIAIAQSLDVDD